MTRPNPNADRTEVCPKCHGGGKETSRGGVMHECLKCNGWGYVRPLSKEAENAMLQSLVDEASDWNGGLGLILPPSMYQEMKARGITGNYTAQPRLPVTMQRAWGDV